MTFENLGDILHVTLRVSLVESGVEEECGLSVDGLLSFGIVWECWLVDAVDKLVHALIEMLPETEPCEVFDARPTCICDLSLLISFTLMRIPRIATKVIGIMITAKEEMVPALMS